MKIVCISDTHGKHQGLEVPEGDLLIHAGDVSRRGKAKEIHKFNDWLGTLSHPYKVVIAGNHDWLFEKVPEEAEALITEAVYLNDSGVNIQGLYIWGSPISPTFYDWAFNRDRGEQIRKHWALIPDNTDILITHGPPKGILDKVFTGEEVGCEDLTEAVKRVRPKYHIFGHIHEAYGQAIHNGTHHINASVLNLRYQLENKAVVFEMKVAK